MINKKKVNKKVRTVRARSKDDVFDFLVKKFDDIVWHDGGRLYSDEIEVIPSPAMSLNWAMGRGGLPRGRVTEIFGPESSGKTTIAYGFVRQLQAQGGSTAFIDVENSIDIRYMISCGIKNPKDPANKVYIVQPDWGEQALEVARELIIDGRIDCIVIDSIAMLIPKSELEGDVSDQQMGLQPRMMSKFSRMVNVDLKGTKVALLVTNQVREKMGGGMPMFGPNTTTPGGRALKHLDTIKMSVTAAQPLKVGAKRLGFMTKVRVVKNKIAPPFREVMLPIVFGYGVDERLDFIKLCETSGALTKRNGIYAHKERVVGNGWRKAYRYLTTHPKFKALLEKRIKAYLDKQGDLEDAAPSSKDESDG